MKLESPERDPTWLQSLPSEAQRCFMKHALDVSRGLYQPEIMEALSGTSADRLSIEKFHTASRVNQRFTTVFRQLVEMPLTASADAAAGPGGHNDEYVGSKTASFQTQESQAEKTDQASRERESAFRKERTQTGKRKDKSAFRGQCEQTASVPCTGIEGFSQCFIRRILNWCFERTVRNNGRSQQCVERRVLHIVMRPPVVF